MLLLNVITYTSINHVEVMKFHEKSQNALCAELSFFTVFGFSIKTAYIDFDIESRNILFSRAENLKKSFMFKKALTINAEICQKSAHCYS